MAINSSFSLQGATPFKAASTTPSFTLPNSTPQSKALNSAQFGGSSGIQTSTPQYSTNVVQPFAVSLGTSPGFLSPSTQQPTSHTTTVNNVDGSSVTHKQTYAASPQASLDGKPATDAQASQLAGGMISNSPLNSNSSGSSSPTPPPPVPPYNANVGTLTSIGSNPNPSITNAQTGLQGVANGQGGNAPVGTPGGQINSAVTGLLGSQANPSPDVLKANQNLETFQKNSPFLLSDVRNNPNVAAQVSVGRGQALGQTLSAENQALATAQQNAVTEQGQQITAGNEAGTLAGNAQGQQITAETNAGNLGVNQQGNQITAANAGASQTHPEQLPYGTQYGSPADLAAGAGGGGSLNPQTAANGLAQKVISGQMSYQDAVSSLGYAGQAGQQFLNQAIQTQKPGFNIAQATGQYAANQQNTTTAGTAATNAYNSAYQTNYPAVLQIQGALKNVQDLGQLAVQTGTGASVNPFNLTYANDTLNTFKSQLSDSGQAQFSNTLATYQGAVSQLLSGSTNVNPTQVAEWTKDIANGSMKMSTFQDVYNQALKEGNIKLSTAQSMANIPGSKLGAPPVTGGQAGTTGQTSGGNSYTIIP